MTVILHIQPALPRYRIDFFERLSQRYGPTMKVIYSPGSLGALTRPVSAKWAIAVGPMQRLAGGLVWQPGVAGLAVGRGDIIVLSGNPRQISTMVLLVRAKLNGARVVWWGHYWSSTSRRWRQLLRHLPMAVADAILFYTDNEVDAFLAEPIPTRDRRIVAALNNGINVEEIRNLRQPFIAAERENALLFIGRLSAKAELELGLQALALLRDKAPVLHVIGDGDLRTVLQVQARKLGLGESIVWHGALVDEARIAEVANRCLAFMYPGEVGLSLIHAMAYTLPAIVHDEPRRHMPEIAAFRAGETGLSFARGDACSLARMIQTMLPDGGRLEQFAAAAAGIVGPSFTTEDMADRFEALITRMTEASQ
ncbi:glycosyltransferase family 4 protein [Cereibacter azotoformans]|uniref:Glycosyltransferase involved in cell wall biosynthesis n=1 Tax=Cereibacter azotoformans TaxID=43057 RepID=A0A2T5JT36_9RHOB|nr:glycosyltransferase family 4 protein [Cereibacter azotoformans]PTR11624.1 glycosyltransferase involved in cell wall biosynthesis [Cereibacter azotoformans]